MEGFLQFGGTLRIQVTEDTAPPTGRTQIIKVLVAELIVMLQKFDELENILTTNSNI